MLLADRVVVVFVASFVRVGGYWRQSSVGGGIRGALSFLVGEL